jgi:ribosomal-protein-alanine N-acetyltransferase
MLDFPALQTSRLTLREIVESDAENILQIHGNADFVIRGVATSSWSETSSS